MGFEKNSRNRFFSKQINIQTSRLYSSKVLKQCVLCRHDNLEMNPWFLTGFTDAEGCFTIGVVKNKKYKVGWTVKLRFQLGVNEKDKFLLLQSKNFFGVGNIYVSESAVQFIVQSVNDLAVIIKHFDKFSLITKKKIDFELFKQVFNIVINKEHITEEGLRKIVAIKASMNLGLSEELKTAFPNITPQDMPLTPPAPLFFFII